MAVIETRCAALAEAERERHERRDRRFAPGNDAIWGAGNWVKCERCPDGEGDPSYHHRNFHHDA